MLDDFPHSSLIRIIFQAKWGHSDITNILLEAGASPSAVDNDVIKPSVKLRQSNIKTP
jgi:hypothetical protein